MNHRIIRKIAASLLMFGLFVGVDSGWCDHFSIDLSTSAASKWTVSAAAFTNAPAFPRFLNTAVDGISVTSTGTGSGFFLHGGDLSTFDGFWTASTEFQLPAAAVNISLTYSNLGCDDSCVLFLNGTAIAATATSAGPGITQGQFVFTDGASSQTWSFTGPDGAPSGTVNSGFILNGTNAITAIVNNTGGGSNGQLKSVYGDGGDNTSFAANLILSYDVVPASSVVSADVYPGISFTGTVGANYQIQYTTSLTNSTWTRLTNLLLPSSPYLYFDSDPIRNHTARYYRVVGL